MKNTKRIDMAISAAIFVLPLILLTVTFYNIGRL